MNVVSQTIDAYVTTGPDRGRHGKRNGTGRGQCSGRPTGDGLEDYMNANDVTLEDQEVEQYNDALLTKRLSSRRIKAVANDESLQEMADSMAYDLRVTYQEAASVFFDSATQ